DGMYYYMVKKTDEKPPSINEIKTGGGKYSGNGPIKQDTPVNFTVNDLETLTDYTIYVVVIDGSDNVSNKESKDFTTIDGQPPTLKLKKGDPMYGGKRVQFVITPTEAGTYYYYIRPKTSAAGPTVDDIIKTHTGTGKATEPGDIIVTEKYYGAKPSLEEIQPNTTYEIFAVMVDASGNKMRTVSDIEIKTEGLDSEHPYVDNPVLELIDKEKGIFELTVFEELDKESAENIDNYILSGTGIMNITGDKETKPSAVTYSGKKIRLTIPSITALVNGDTIRVTVLPGVKDLAENPFENIDTVPVEQVPRNYAEYKHGDSMIPVIKITDVIPGPDKYEVEVETKKAGTYYYMILPDSFNFTKKDITNRDFVDEFSSDKVIVKDKFVTKDKDGNPVIGNDGKPKTDYLSKGENPAVLGKFKFDVQKPSNIDPFTSYSLYVVLKDRSGQLSIMDSRQLISDSKPPLVSGITAKPVPKTDDKDVKIEFNVDEKGTAFFIPVKKYIMKDGIRTLNAEYFNPDGTMKDVPGTHEANLSDAERRAKFEKIGAVESKGMDGSGSFNHTLKGLDAHEEYGIYIGVEDTFKNFTVRQRSTPTAIGDLEPSGDPMKVTVYTDGTKPYIKTDRSNIYSKLHTEALIYRTPDPSDPKFEITFNEAILRQADLTNYNTSLISINDALNLSSIMVIKDASNKDITAEFVYDSYVVGTSTTADSKLVIKPIDEANANKSITISLKEDITNAYDYQKLNTFDIDKIGKYVYPKTFVNIMSDAKLGPRTDDPSNSKKITITPQLSATSVKEIYYVVVNTGTVDVPTEVQILDLVRYNKQPTNMMINLYGKRLIEKPGDTSNEMTLEANGTGSNVFRKGQRVYMITLDEYGNVAWVVNETNDKQKYSTVVE
ncbi:MAG: hypothetical protein RR588_10205, partial [Solibacillus sp.]